MAQANEPATARTLEQSSACGVEGLERTLVWPELSEQKEE